MIPSKINVVAISMAMLALVVGFGQQPALGIGLEAGGTLVGGALNMLPNVMSSATNMVNGLTSPMMGAVGAMSGGLQSSLNGVLSSSLGGVGTLAGGESGILGNTMRLSTGVLNGMTTGLSTGLGGLGTANGLGTAYGQPNALNAELGAGQLMNQNMLLRNNYKREAIADSAIAGAASEMMSGSGTEAVVGALAESAVDASAQAETGLIGSSNAVSGALATGAAANVIANQAIGNSMVGASSLVGGRQALTAEAIRSAQAESAAAGAEMVQNGAINARSASLASNAYRQAKLAGARDRVNIAGTIQNSARISDAAIATHDTATKAEDSLLGSELAVDSAATVFDSDGAYIPPVTASLLRSLPYGRLGLRNIIPKPLTYPSMMLPDVWLNGVPVNYQNVPLRMLPYGIGPAQSVNSLMFSQTAAANGAIINGQPFIANNGLILNGLVLDPAYAYLTNANINGAVGTSLLPIIANGQLEAQDELAMANMLNMQQLNGVGMSSTYQGYGRLNPVPMITGSVSDVNLMPTTTIGTTYPIGSALVIEPRDSFFQDYTDNASSRQNFDERQQ